MPGGTGVFVHGFHHLLACDPLIYGSGSDLRLNAATTDSIVQAAVSNSASEAKSIDDSSFGAVAPGRLSRIAALTSRRTSKL